MSNLTATIEKLVYKGFGLARYQEKVIFIPYTVPEDKISFSIVKDKKTHAYGKVRSLLTSSPHRICPDCEVFGKCGGCNWLHINYSYQLQAKSDIIKELYPHIDETFFLPIQDSPQIHAYRNKVFYPVTLQNGTPNFGIFALHTHKVIPHKNCKLVPSILDDIGRTLMEFLEKVNEQPYYEKNHSGNIRHIGFRISQKQEIIVIIVTRKRRLAFTKSLQREITDSFKTVIGIVQNINPNRGNTILGDSDKVLYGDSSFEECIDGLQFRVQYQSFFQINVPVATDLFRFVNTLMNPDDIVLDAYCGMGIISLLAAKHVKKVIGIDSNEAAIRDANYNKKINNINNAMFQKGNVEDTLPALLEKETIHTVIFDPPRKGLDFSIIQMLQKVKVETIIYVSCDPVTQKRDVIEFTESGYEIVKIKPFDMFPQTFHIENVIVLQYK